MTGRVVDLYESDFLAWTRQQARALRRLRDQRSNLPLDLDRLALEIRDLGSEQLFAVRSQLVRLLVHALKLERSAHDRPRRQWLVSVASAQDEIRARLSPSLRRKLVAALPGAYAAAREQAALALEDHGEPAIAADLPPTCPWTLDQLLEARWPAERE